MKRIAYPGALQALIAELKRLPGIGPRSAERIALWMVQKRDARPGDLAAAITAMTATVCACKRCAFFASDDLCDICSDSSRDASLLCVVEQPTDILPLERTGAFRGFYHALGGRISPLDHIGPDDLRISQLMQRIENEHPTELILALNADVEGDATSSYLAGLLRGHSLTVTRLAQGLPAGGGLDFADDLTLSRALSGRTKVSSPAG